MPKPAPVVQMRTTLGSACPCYKLGICTVTLGMLTISSTATDYTLGYAHSHSLPLPLLIAAFTSEPTTVTLTRAVTLVPATPTSRYSGLAMVT